MKRALTIALLFSFSLAFGSNGEKRHATAHRVAEQMTIDGVLDELAWRSASTAVDFTQSEPNPGTRPSHPTEVRIVYDDKAVYVGAKLYDSSDGISKQLFERDNLSDEIETDWFGFAIDTYMDGINGFAFLVTPAGVQIDIKFTSDGDDDSWDAVWNSEVSIVSDGWIVEMEIPYSALRFPDKQIQQWHLHLARKRFQTQEENFWSPIDPQIDGFFNQAGILDGIQDVKSPVRLSATPFIALYAENFYDKNASPKSTWGRSINGGMDIRYGISDAFTLDMTLIPDFGQVRSDNEVLNLSPFEVQFNENRQFFTEGTELFGKAGLFYSRRVGGTPFYADDVEVQLQDGEEIISSPSESQLYNATKISGRTSGGTGIGLFNAVAGREYAIVRNSEDEERQVLTNPLTNYSVLVVDQNLKNNSYVSLVNTNVWREGSAYEANVTGTEFELNDNNNVYRIGGNASVSQKYFSNHTDLGHKYSLSFGKQSGVLVWQVSYNEESDTYDRNDLGFIFNNNERSARFFIEYNQYEPFGNWNRMGGGLQSNIGFLYKLPGDPGLQFRDNLFTEHGVNIWWWAQSKSFLEYNIWTYFTPSANYDYFEPRMAGRFLAYPVFWSNGFSFSTDSRKKFNLSLDLRYRWDDKRDRNQQAIEIEPQYRFSDKFALSFQLEATQRNGDMGYVTDFGPEQIVIGVRDLTNIENRIRARYSFNRKMNIDFRLRHNWTKVAYQSFHDLNIDGTLAANDYSENEDINFNAFNIDAVYRWRFAPGSDIFVVWKNSILGLDEHSDFTFWQNLRQVNDLPQRNSLSLKILYYLDYQSFVKRV